MQIHSKNIESQVYTNELTLQLLTISRMQAATTTLFKCFYVRHQLLIVALETYSLVQFTTKSIIRVNGKTPQEKFLPTTTL